MAPELPAACPLCPLLTPQELWARGCSLNSCPVVPKAELTAPSETEIQGSWGAVASNIISLLSAIRKYCLLLQLSLKIPLIYSLFKMNYRYNFHCFCSSLKYKETIVRNFPEQRNKVLQQFVPLTCFKDRHGGLRVVHSDLSFLNIQPCEGQPRQNPHFFWVFSRAMEIGRESRYCFVRCSPGALPIYVIDQKESPKWPV